jgi:hypothetical protein
MVYPHDVRDGLVLRGPCFRLQHRWKLVCRQCKVRYGACIQCEDKSCKTAFHPLCARGHGLCMQVVNSKDVPATSYQRNLKRGKKGPKGKKAAGEENGNAVGGEAGGANEGGDRRSERGAKASGGARNGELGLEGTAAAAGKGLRGSGETKPVERLEDTKGGNGERNGVSEGLERLEHAGSGGTEKEGLEELEEGDEPEEALRLLAWCPKHKKPESTEVGKVTVREKGLADELPKVRAEDYDPPKNASGSARTGEEAARLYVISSFSFFTSLEEFAPQPGQPLG